MALTRDKNPEVMIHHVMCVTALQKQLDPLRGGKQENE